MREKGALGISLAGTQWIYSIDIAHDNSAVWNYDPAIETYDIFYVTTQDIQSNNLEEADFPLDYDDLPAQYLTNLQGGMALNKRIAISQVMYQGNKMTPWTLQNNGGLKSLYTWHNFAICDLKEGDRVVIQIWSGQAKFSSKAENMAYNGCSAFLDVQNNGDFDEGEDTEITCGMGLGSLATYVITEDGHLDIALSGDGVFCKVYIYGDHQAQMVDRYGATPAAGNTSYFDATGQLQAKHHIVPGGLHVYVGNQNDAHHAMVVSTDAGPASFVYDEKHFKTPNLNNNSFDLWYYLPVEGTFYRFVPDVDGTMTVRFKANSVNYRDWNKPGNKAVDQAGTPNETNPNVSCPYYLMKNINDLYHNNEVQTKGNGATVAFENVAVTAGQTYYLYGWWDNTSNYTDYNNHACGVAELIDVTFKPSKYVYPLAKWVESGATEVEAADITGYNQVCIKKKSDNIASCEVAIEGDKLKVKNITYKANANPGGVILVKVGDPNNDGDPVFALTIAYDAGFNEQVVGTDVDGNDIKRTEGYTWNFSDNSLRGLKWNNKNAEADVVDFGTHFNNFATASKDNNGVPTNGTNSSSLLTEEINKGDWTFNYRVKKSSTFMDPRFLNNYDMEGDNADMMWDTQGIIINAGSTQSCIFNEHGVSIDHTNKTQADPDRYVGFLEGGEFIIPKLKAGDRVIVYMGSGAGSGTTAMKFHITNALDAMHKAIDPADDYWAGGSQWNVPNGHNDPYYRGCYHFYAAADGDMKFKMVGGSMCKLYSIQIYRGERIETNAVQENGQGYTILATKAQDGTITTGEASWNLHYRGKGEAVAKGEGKNSQVNEIIAHSGSITHYDSSDLVRTGDQGVKYTNQGEIGMLRIRVKCMEYNQNYVTDFSDRNITLALHETKSYPYTWDFTDISGYNATQLSAEDAIPETTIEFEEKGYDLSAWKAEDSGEYAMNIYGPTTGYNNQSMIFENSKGISGNQLYAGNRVIPETQGLWFYMDNNDPSYNGSMKIGADGLRLANTKDTENDIRRGWWNYKMVIPAVPAGAAVYLRVARDNNVGETEKDGQGNYFFHKKFRFDKHMPIYPTYNADKRKWEATYVKYQIGDGPREDDVTSYTWNESVKVDNVTYQAGSYQYDNQYEKYSKYYEAADGSGDYIIAIYNWGEESDLILTLNGFVLKKMSVSEDFKSLDSNGWATESREHVIDPALTAYLTGNDIETCFVEEINYGKVGGEGKVLLTRADLSDSSKGQIIRAAADGDAGACILHNTANEPVKILNDGFHLFVPDMHDFEDTNFKNNDATGMKTITTTSNGILKAQVSAGTIPAKEGDYTNYILSNKKYAHDGDTGEESVEAFYRVSPTKPAKSNGHNAYLQMETGKVTGTQANTFEVVFELDNEADGINEVNDTKSATTEGFYTIDGQKLNGMPTNSGLYIVNGKKVIIK